MPSMFKLCMTVPEQFVQRIDRERGDIPRSRYILRILERAYGLDNKGDDE